MINFFVLNWFLKTNTKINFDVNIIPKELIQAVNWFPIE
jgi:hypothetical protein